MTDVTASLLFIGAVVALLGRPDDYRKPERGNSVATAFSYAFVVAALVYEWMQA